MQFTPPKPRSRVIRNNLTHLPRLTRRRQILRSLIHWVTKALAWVFMDAEVKGLEHLPRRESALVVSNHLGDADLILWLAISPVAAELMAKVELYDLPVLGKILDAYGVIWVHRGHPDRRAIRAALQGLDEGRLIGIAPEGRESVTGSLEQGTGGAAYIALKTDSTIVPVTFTGTENWRVYGNLLRLRRSKVTLTLGQPFKLKRYPHLKESVRVGTESIMISLARQLPSNYRGVYDHDFEGVHERE